MVPGMSQGDVVQVFVAYVVKELVKQALQHLNNIDSMPQA